jgi:hypothetical protein
MPVSVNRPAIATCIALLSIPLLACQKSEKKDPPAAEPATGSDDKVKTEKSPPKPADDSMADVTIKATQVAGHIYMLEGRGGNIGVSAGEDGVVLIDDQFAPLAPKILGRAPHRAHATLHRAEAARRRGRRADAGGGAAGRDLRAVGQPAHERRGDPAGPLPARSHRR